MEKKVVIHLFDKDIGVVIKDASSFLRTSHYAFGQIYISCPINTPLEKIQEHLIKVYKKEKIDQFDPNLLYTKDYVYILGEKVGLIQKNSGLVRTKNELYIKDDEDLKNQLTSLCYDIILHKVRKYEKLLETYEHKIKITNMSQAAGKNYFKKKLLTFHWELIHFSNEIIDSVIIHELVHDFVQNHSSDFYDILYKYCPRYDELREKMLYGVKK